MGVSTDLDDCNIPTSIEDLSEEERQEYLGGHGALQRTILDGIQEG